MSTCTVSDSSSAVRWLFVLGGLLLFACGGVSVQGARPWTRQAEAGDSAGHPTGDNAQAVMVAAYELGRCSDVLGQALPMTPERITLYRITANRAGVQLQLRSESQGLTPLVFENRLHADDGHTFQAILNDKLLEIRLPTESRKGHWLLASHWEQWQQAQGFGARPVRVVERCELAALPKPPASADTTKGAASAPVGDPAFGLAKPALPGYGMRPVHDRPEQ